MGISPLGVSGVSQYASDLQNVLNRAVQIASIPVKQLQNRDSDLLQQKTLLGQFRSAVADFSDSLASLGDIAAHKAITATSSDSAVASISSVSTSASATYTINSVTSIATIASERSQSSYADSASTPVSSTGQMQLKVGTQAYSFSLAANSLIGLRDKINSLGAGVSASILTTGNGNYLSVTANTAGQTTLQLIDDPSGTPTHLLTSANQGTDTVFQLNGIALSQKSNVVNSVVPGVTFEILKPSATPVTISLSSNRSKLSTALQSFVDRYNALKAHADAQTGKNAGLLTGDAAVAGVSRTLREITSFGIGGGKVRGLADLGITFNGSGEANFNTATFQSLSDTALADAFTYLGSTTTGLGGYSRSLAQYSDPISGFIKQEQDGIDRTDTSIQKQIAALTDRINGMQSQLAGRLALADSLLSQLESQQKSLAASLQGLNLVLYGKSNQ